MLSFTVCVDGFEVNVSLVYYEFILRFFENLLLQCNLFKQKQSF